MKRSAGREHLTTGRNVAHFIGTGTGYRPEGGREHGEAFDLQKKCMELILGFIGFTDITPVVVEPTLGKPEPVAKMKAEAAERARSVAGAF